MTTINVVSRAAVVLVLVIAGMAMLLGLQTANVPGQIAGAQATAQAASYQAELNRLELTRQANAVVAQATQAAIEADRRKAQDAQDLEHQRALDVQERENAGRHAQLVDLLLAVLAAVLGIAILLVALAVAMWLLRAAPAARRPVPDLRSELRTAARANELLERQLAERRAARPATPGANGQHKLATEPTKTSNKEYGSGEPATTVRLDPA